MSTPADLSADGTNGNLEERLGDNEVKVNQEEEEEEESDYYEEEEDEEGGQGEGGEDAGEVVQEGQNTLTHLLLGNTNGTIAENEAEFEEDSEDGEEGDNDDDDEYVDDEEDDTAPPVPLNKKRSIDEVAEEEASQGSKKIKA